MTNLRKRSNILISYIKFKTKSENKERIPLAGYKLASTSKALSDKWFSPNSEGRLQFTSTLIESDVEEVKSFLILLVYVIFGCFFRKIILKVESGNNCFDRINYVGHFTIVELISTRRLMNCKNHLQLCDSMYNTLFFVNIMQ